MLGFIKTTNYTEITCEKKTNSYNLEKCKQTAIQIIKDPKVVLNMNINDTQHLENQMKNATFDTLDVQFSEPLTLFSECFEPHCHLSRNNNEVRSYFENKLLELNCLIPSSQMGSESTGRPTNLTYTSYMSGYYFQDIVILTKLINEKKITHLTYNILSATRDYTEYIASERNPLRNNNQINGTFEIMRLNTDVRAHTYEFYKQQSAYMTLMTYRLLKLIEYLESLDVKVCIRIYDTEVNYYDQCLLDESFRCDIYCGIDYIESAGQNFNDFKIFALTCTKNDGYICSLHTDGFGSKKLYGEIVINKNVDTNTQIINTSLINIKNNNKMKYVIEKKISELEHPLVKTIVVDGKEYTRDVNISSRNILNCMDTICFVSLEEYNEALKMEPIYEKQLYNQISDIWNELIKVYSINDYIKMKSKYDKIGYLFAGLFIVGITFVMLKFYRV